MFTFFFFLNIYLKESMSERDWQWGVAGKEGQADSALSVEPDVGLYPRILRSLTELKSRVGYLTD